MRRLRLGIAMGLLGTLGFGWFLPVAFADGPAPTRTPRCKQCGYPMVGLSIATDAVQRAGTHAAGCPMVAPRLPQGPLASPQSASPTLPSSQSGTAAMGAMTGAPGAGSTGTGGAAGGTGAGAGGTGAGAGGAAGGDGTTPGGTGTGAAGTGAADSGTGAPGLGTNVSGQAASQLTVFGDLSPLQAVSGLPGKPPVGRFATRGAAPPSFVKGFKIADNQSVLPVDRIYYDFNFFDNVNQPVNNRIQNGIQRVQIYRELIGGEKTFFDGQASVGVRLPINTITGDSPTGGVSTPTKTAINNINVYTKYLFYSDTATKTFAAAGLAVTIPTGPQNFAGASYVRNYNNPELQPYIGFQKTWDRLYFLGFEAINVPLNTHDVTTLYNDYALGYFVYRSQDKRDLIQGIAPTVEVHINNPLNHRDIFNVKDKAGAADIVDFTSGLNIFFKNKVQLGMAVVTPVTGPRPFSLESLAFLNVYF
jgi:hypothetical protein